MAGVQLQTVLMLIKKCKASSVIPDFTLSISSLLFFQKLPDQLIEPHRIQRFL